MDDIMIRNMVGYWTICRGIMMGNINDESIEAHLCCNTLLQVTPSGEGPYYCIGCYDASKLMKVIKSMVRKAMNKGKCEKNWWGKSIPSRLVMEIRMQLWERRM